MPRKATCSPSVSGPTARRARASPTGLTPLVLLAAAAVLAGTGAIVATRERSARSNGRRWLRTHAGLRRCLWTAPDLRTSLLLSVAAYRLQPSADPRGWRRCSSRFAAWRDGALRGDPRMPDVRCFRRRSTPQGASCGRRTPPERSTGTTSRRTGRPRDLISPPAARQVVPLSPSMVAGSSSSPARTAPTSTTPATGASASSTWATATRCSVLPVSTVTTGAVPTEAGLHRRRPLAARSPRVLHQQRQTGPTPRRPWPSSTQATTAGRRGGRASTRP